MTAAFGEVAEVMTTHAKAIVNDPSWFAFDANEAVSPKAIEDLLSEFAKDVEFELGLGQFLTDKLDQWVSTAAETVERNRHMNDVKDRTTMNGPMREALLVDFINFAALPIGLAFYTSDLRG